MELCSCRGWIGLLSLSLSLSLMYRSLSVVQETRQHGKTPLSSAALFPGITSTTRNRRKPADKVDALRLITLARAIRLYSRT